MEVNKYYMQTPMRCIVQNLHKSSIQWLMVSDRSAYGPATMHKDAKKDLFLAFLSPFLAYHANVAGACCEWSGKHAANFGSNTMQQTLHNASLAAGNQELDTSAYEVKIAFIIAQKEIM